MKKICICILVLLMACSKVFAAVPCYTIIPINSNAQTVRGYRGAISSHIQVRSNTQPIGRGTELTLVVTTNEGWETLTGLRVIVYVSFPDGSRGSISLSDDIVSPDGMRVAGSGVYTASFTLRDITEGQIILTANVTNPYGTARPTYLLSMRGEGPLFGEPIAEFFQRRAQTAIDVF